MTDEFQSPFNALPRVVVALAVVIGGLEAMFQLAGAGFLGGQGGVGWRIAAIEDYGVLDVVWHWMVANNTWPWDQVLRFLTYPLIHGGALHAIFVIVFVLAMGNMVATVFHPLAFLGVFWVSAIVGALAFVTVMNAPYPLIGGYPGVYGLIGAFTYLLWVGLAAQGANQYRAFTLIAVLMGIQVLFGLIQFDFGNVVAELVGFAAGFLMSFVVSPGGWSRVVEKLRQR